MHAGDYLAFYYSGLGATDLTNNLLSLYLQSGAIKPSFAGPAPGFAGVYQVNLQLPADSPPRLATLQIDYAGGNLVVFHFSNLVYFPVR